MRLLAPDTETHLIAPGLAAPPHVCTSWATANRTWLTKGDDARRMWKRSLRDCANGKVTLTNVTMHYDMAVVMAQWPQLAALVFAAYESGNVHCSTIDQRLIDIANGCLERVGGKKTSYSLQSLAWRRLKRWRDKSGDTWRLRYAELEHVPLEDWPEDAVSYALDDARDAYDITWDMYETPEDWEILEGAGEQAYASFALYLMTCRGIRTDAKACRALIDALEVELKRCETLLVRKGLLTLNTSKSAKSKYKKNLKAARERLRRSLPKSIRRELDAAVEDAKAYAAKGARDARDKVKFDWQLDDKEFARAERKLAKLLKRDVSHKERLRQWERLGYDEQLWIDMRSLVRKPRPYKALGVSVTKTGLISVGANACKASKKESLVALATFTSANTMRQKAQRLLKGSVIPLQTTYQNPINSGRTSSRKSEAPLVGDNFQNFRRSAMHIVHDLDAKAHDIELPGMRECIIPRDDYDFCSIDLNSAEMRGYAQIEYDHLGVSELRDVLNAGKNPHRVLGAYILGIDEDEFERRYAQGDPECVQAAQFAKIPNFALLGGGGYKILPDYAKGMGISLELDMAKDLYDAFHRRWAHVKEMHKYFRSFIHKVYRNPRTGFFRYLDRYAQACNNPFQNIIAHAAKRCCTQLAKAEYVPGGELWGSYSVLFLHDEVLFEMPQLLASVHAWRATKIMIDACNHYMPDVPMTAEPALMRRFSKGAKTVTHKTKKDSDGNPLLLVWEP